MIPLRDENPTQRLPVVTIIIIVINLLLFVYQLTLTSSELQSFWFRWGVVPTTVVGTLSSGAMQEIPVLLTAIFLHGGWGHFLGNMLYLWIFGDNIEAYLGSIAFAGFYLFCGVVATVAQIVVEPAANVPIIGASGAIAGVLGAYIMLHPYTRVTTLIPIIFLRIQLPAVIVLGFWFILQLFSGIVSLGAQAQTGGGVAFFAHIGGFVTGFFLIKLFKLSKERPEASRQSKLSKKSKDDAIEEREFHFTND